VFDEEPLTPEVLEPLFWEFQRFSDVDSLRSLLLTKGGYRKISFSFAKASKVHQSAAVIPFRNLLSRGEEIRKQIAEGKASLLNTLDSLASIATREGIRASASIVSLFSNSPDSEIAVKEILFSAVKGNDLNERNGALDCLMEAAAMPEVRSRLLEFGAKELVQPFAEDDKSDANFVAVLIIALLSASDVNEKNKTDMKPTSPTIISRIIKALDTFATSSRTEISTTVGYVCRCKLILLATRSLATNEANLKELKTQNVVSVLKELLTARRQNLFLVHSETLEQVRGPFCINVDLNCFITNFSSLRRPCALFGPSPLTRIATTSSLLLGLLIFLSHFRPITLE